ncbi:MAG: hypothetical protein ACKOCA_01950 [Vulcanococcus sp.]
MIGLKTHTKIALVVRKEKERLRSYCHIATSNLRKFCCLEKPVR